MSFQADSESKKVSLPSDFVPTDRDVVIGRGKKCYNHAGNQILRRIVASRLRDYSASTHKYSKTIILSSIVAEIRKFGGFVKEDKKGRWFDVGDQLAKDKVAQTFRDALHEQYKSSTTFKTEKRRQQRKKKAQSPAGVYNFEWRNDIFSPQNIAALSNRTSPLEPVDVLSKLSLCLSTQIFEDENPFEPIPISEALERRNRALETTLPLSAFSDVTTMENDSFCFAVIPEVHTSIDSQECNNYHSKEFAVQKNSQSLDPLPISNIHAARVA